MACEGKLKGIVSWQWKDEAEQSFESAKCPVTVQLTPIADTTNNHWIVRRISGEYLWQFDSPSYNLFLDKTYEERDKTGYSLIQFVNASGQVVSQVVWDFYVTVEPTEVTGCRLEIFDATGKVFTQERTNKKCPEYNIKCDDDCPENHIKCKCNKYPGFCCIPCGEVQSKITSATSTLKGIKS